MVKSVRGGDVAVLLYHGYLVLLPPAKGEGTGVGLKHSQIITIIAGNVRADSLDGCGKAISITTSGLSLEEIVLYSLNLMRRVSRFNEHTNTEKYFWGLRRPARRMVPSLCCEKLDFRDLKESQCRFHSISRAAVACPVIRLAYRLSYVSDLKESQCRFHCRLAELRWRAL